MATGPVGTAAAETLRSVETFAGERPLFVVAAILAAVLLLVGAFFLYRWIRRSPGEQLQRTLADFESVAILMHADPDPDAMGSAMGLAELAAAVDTDPTIYYPGEIRRHENRAFRTVLDLDFVHVEDATDMYGEPVMLVDHGEARGFDGAETVDPVAIVDHHPGTNEGREFTDIRSDYGACASIVTEYLRSVGVTADEDGEHVLSAGLASALLYGIQTDTSYLSRGCSAADFAACKFLYPAIDSDVLDRIANPPVDAETLDVKARAIRGRLVRIPFVVSDVGEVSNVDTIPQAAEELLQLEGATAVVVFGEKNGTYHISGRSRDDRVHMGHALELAVSEMVNGAAGGHARMGGGQILDGDSSEVDRARLTDRLFTAMNGEEA